LGREALMRMAEAVRDAAHWTDGSGRGMS